MINKKTEKMITFWVDSKLHFRFKTKTGSVGSDIKTELTKFMKSYVGKPEGSTGGEGGDLEQEEHEVNKIELPKTPTNKEETIKNLRGEISNIPVFDKNRKTIINNSEDIPEDISYTEDKQ